LVLAAVLGGAVLGALIGGLIGGLTYQPCTDPACFDLGREFDVWAGAFIGLVIGAVGGMVWGLWRWRRRA
jgi:hypothetical protein